MLTSIDLTLQFGHGTEAVENRAGVVHDATAASFNSATALRPWKTRIGTQEESARTGASIRPRH